LSATALLLIPVGVVVERRKAKSPWLDVLWRPVSVLAGQPSATPWTPIGNDGEADLFYAGEAMIELHRTETVNYRDNLRSGAAALWVVLRPTASQPAYELLTVTADPRRYTRNAGRSAWSGRVGNTTDQGLGVPRLPNYSESPVDLLLSDCLATPFDEAGGVASK